MAEIRRVLSFLIHARSWLTMVVLVYSPLYSNNIFSQQQSGKKIEILSFGRMGKNDRIDPDLIIFSGNVHIKHNEALMWCDSAYHYDKKNQVTAFGNIHIQQGDTLNLYGDYLYYDGNTEKAFVRGNVKLIDKETVLNTDIINYELDKRIAFYNTEGRIINGDQELVSKKGIYYSNEKMFHFSKDIVITGPDYVIEADTMNYSTEKEIVYFTGPTEINGDSIRIFAHRGWYDTGKKTSRIWDNAIVDNFQQIIKGDTLYYEEKQGFGIAIGNISIIDTANNSIVNGNLAEYHKNPESFIVTDRALYIMQGESDTMYMHADTLRAITLTDSIIVGDSTVSYRLIRAYYGTRIFSHDFQAKADSLTYSFRDSTIKMFGNPVLRSEENQLTADSMTLFTINSRMDKMELYNKAFIISQVDSLRFNQIKGRALTGYFDDNKLYKVLVEGNGESVYFLIEGEELVGVNYSKSSNIEIIVEDSKIKEVTEFGNPDGMLDPPMLKKPEEMRLQGFSWLNHLRPVNKNDVFRRN